MCATITVLAGCSGDDAADGGMVDVGLDDGGVMDSGAVDAATSDAGSDAGPGIVEAVAPPAMPAPPAPPAIGACPEGWRAETHASGVDYCEPWPATGFELCAGDEAHFPGTAGCERLGPACPAGDFPTDLPAGASVIYVRTGATGGDGRMVAPFGTITDATSVATAGDVIAVARGRYDESFVIPMGVTLHGACVADTFIAAPDFTTSGAARVTATGVTVRNVSFGGGQGRGLYVGPTGQATAEDVLVDGARSSGVLVNGGTLIATDLVIRDTRPASDGRFGRGMEIVDGASVQLTRTLVERCNEFGIAVYGDLTTVQLDSVAVRETESQSMSGQRGNGVAVQGGGLDATGLVLEQNRYAGAGVFNAGTVARMASVVIRDTRSQVSDGTGGGGVLAMAGASVEVRGGLVASNRSYGVMSYNSGSSVRVEDAVIANTIGSEDGGDGAYGIFAWEGGNAYAARSVLYENRWAGAVARNTGARVELEDVVVKRTLGRESDGRAGYGLYAYEEGTAGLSRVAFERNDAAAIFATGSGVQADLEDVSITGALPADGPGGSGMRVEEGATVNATRLSSQSSIGGQVMVRGAGSSAVLEDLSLRDARPDVTGDFGVGLQVSEGGAIVVRRAESTGNRYIGVFVTSGSSATIEDLLVRDTAPRPDGSYGWGMSVATDSSATLQRVRVEANHASGLVCHRRATVDAEDLAVVGTLPGADDDTDGMGIVARDDCSLSVVRGLFEGNHRAGIYAGEEGTELTLEQVTIRDTRSQRSDGRYGRGLQVFERASATVSHSTFVDNREIAVMAYGGGSQISLDDVVVSGTLPAECAESTCPGEGIGIGIGAYALATMTANDFSIRDAPACGAHVADEAELDLENGSIESCGVGACVQVDGYDQSRLTMTVDYSDNGADVEASELPLVDPGPLFRFDE